MKKLIWQFLVLLFFILGLYIKGFTQDFEFDQVFPDDAGNFTSVTDIKQDREGFIWFTTKRGLYKYDGNQLTSFVNDPTNSNSLSSNLMLCLQIDNNGVIWMGGLGSGLNRFDSKTGIFTQFLPDPNDPGSIANDTINAILSDSYGKLWIATQQGLDRYDEATNTFIHIKSVENDPSTLSDRMARTLYEDRQRTLWVGTGSPFPQNGGRPIDGGLSRYSRDTGNFTRYRNIPGDENSLSNNKVSAIYEDNEGVFWVGTAGCGLHIMNRETGKFARILYDPANPEKLGIPLYTGTATSDFIHFITQDITGGYWLGTKRSGLFYYNPKLGKMSKIMGPGMETNGNTESSVRTAFTSRDGILWIGTDQGNLYRVNVSQKKIPNIRVSTAPVTNFYEEQDGTFWIGTANDLIRINKKTGDTLKFVTELNFSEGVSDDIFEIDKDRQGSLWVSGRTGLYRWDENNGKFIGYRHDPKNENSLSDTRVITFFDDSQNNFWVGTMTGLNLMDRKTGKFTYFNSFTNKAVTSINEDKSGRLWIGVWSHLGIFQYNRETKTFKNYLYGSGIMTIYEDSDGVLWAGGDDGLYRYNPDIDHFDRIGDSYALIGLPDVYNLVEDNQKNLWIGTSDGIVMLNPERNATSLFGKNYGIEKNSLSWVSAYKGINGDIYFGNNTGYHKINPVDFRETAKQPDIVFTGFYLSDQPVEPTKNGILNEALQDTREIKLNYNQNVFSFEFTIIDYTNPQENRLLYYLGNYDNDWKQNSERRAYYFNVPPGKYVFHVKGANSDGIWAEKKIDIIILPPWYRTSLAYGFYALLFIILVFGFDRFMRRRIILAERQKAQKRELEQAREIEKAYTELKSTQTQLIQAEKMASLGELTAGIAHEIQNPLNFVNNFSEVNMELIDEMQQELKTGKIDEAFSISNDIKENEQKISNHGKRAESIVKGMLLHSRGSSGQKEPTDINALCDEYLRLSYHGFRAKDKSFNAGFKLEADENLPKISVVPQDIGRVLLNLINNAFFAVNEKAKQNIEDYKPEVNVSTKYSPLQGGKGGVEIHVSDNGPGIPDSIKEKIFQPFYTTKPAGQGTGLGLSLSYDIVTKGHNGELKVNSVEGSGTEFNILIPVQT